MQSAQESRDAEVANQSGTSGANSDVFEVETVTTLREKVHKLEREIGLLRLSPLSQTDTSQLSSTTDSGASSTDVTLLQAEIHDLTASKKEREEALIGAKKHSAELQAELNKVHRALADTEASLQAAQATAATLKDAQQKSTIFSGTAKMLEEKLKLAEANADRLEQDRSKLEAYARRTLSCFKDKYMSTLQTMKSEKRALEERVTQLTSRHERNQETTRREERLMMSAMYEIGVRMMDRKIQEQVLEPANQQMGANTFLGAQRQSQVAMLGGVGMTNNISQLGVQSSPVPMTPSK